MSRESQVDALRRIARRVMKERGLLADFSPEAMAQLAGLSEAEIEAAHDAAEDLRGLLWCSIDNDDSKDLDQLSVCEELAGDDIRLIVAVADVDALVSSGTPIDDHAAHNTTSVYTAAQIFPMLPERLSTDLTSLNPDEDRVALIISYVVATDGTVSGGKVSRARVRSRAKLTYDAVGRWLEGDRGVPEKVTAVAGLEGQLRAQDRAAQRLRRRRLEHGALQLESLESRPIFDGDKVVGLRVQEQNRAKQLIEELMVASNGISAEFLEARKLPGLRRVVRSPERWGKIVALAATYGHVLPEHPASKPLDDFLCARRLADPLRFPDLSLTVVKLMGRGEYVAEAPGEDTEGHFGLAVKDYSHTTAPNRRFPDLVTHRQLKAALDGGRPVYSLEQLAAIAGRCSEMETMATKVERQVAKSAAALVLDDKIGQVFDGLVTGVSDKGTFARVFNPPVEGRVESGEAGLKVGDRVRLQLVSTNFERGFIDFARVR